MAQPLTTKSWRGQGRERKINHQKLRTGIYAGLRNDDTHENIALPFAFKIK